MVNDVGELLIVRFSPRGAEVVDRTPLIEPDTESGFASPIDLVGFHFASIVASSREVRLSNATEAAARIRSRKLAAAKKCHLSLVSIEIRPASHLR